VGPKGNQKRLHVLRLQKEGVQSVIGGGKTDVRRHNTTKKKGTLSRKTEEREKMFSCSGLTRGQGSSVTGGI